MFDDIHTADKATDRHLSVIHGIPTPGATVLIESRGTLWEFVNKRWQPAQRQRRVGLRTCTRQGEVVAVERGMLHYRSSANGGLYGVPLAQTVPALPALSFS